MYRFILMQEFNPLTMIRDSALILPEMMDVLRKSPLILTEGMRALEANLKKPPSGPLNGVRGTLLAGFCLVAGALLLAFQWPMVRLGSFILMAVSWHSILIDTVKRILDGYNH